MLFLHLLPSPSPCALLLTPNPQEEYGARARRGPDREVGRPGPSSSPAGPVGVWRLGGSRGPPGDRLGHRGWGWGAHCALRGSPDLPASWGPVRPAERLPPQEAAPLALGPVAPATARTLDAREHSGTSSPPPFPLPLPLPLSPSPPALIFLFLCLFLSSPSLIVSSFPFFLFLSCPLKSPPPCKNNASSWPKSQKRREKKKKLTRCSLWALSNLPLPGPHTCKEIF